MEEAFSDLLALVEQDGFRAVARCSSRGGQYNGPCPWCGGHDRFRVQPQYGTYGWFACAQCGRKGSAVDYLVQRRGLSRRDALLAVGWQPTAGSVLPVERVVTPAAALHERACWEEPAERWQNAAWDFARACRDTLWSEAGRAGLDYLRGRGLADSTIQAVMLGYHAGERYGSALTWGRTVRLCRGIVIPWYTREQIWRLTIRDEQVATGSGRYRQVGGGSNGLYLADTLRYRRALTVMTEGEFDALSVAQVCGKYVSVVATGTAQGGHTPRWLGWLAGQARVLVAFDSEEAGDRAAAWWLARLDNARRLRPWWKDANQMLQDGADLAAWLAETG